MFSNKFSRRQILSAAAVLLGIVLISTAVFSAAHKKTVFSALKSASSVEIYEFNYLFHLQNSNSSTRELNTSFSINGVRKGDSLQADVIITVSNLTYSMNDLIRIVDGTLYVNLKSAFSSWGRVPKEAGYTPWISLPLDCADSSMTMISSRLPECFVSALLQSISSAEISSKDSSWTVRFSKENNLQFLAALCGELNSDFPLHEFEQHLQDADTDFTTAYYIDQKGKKGYRNITQSLQIQYNDYDADNLILLSAAAQISELKDVSIELPDSSLTSQATTFEDVLIKSVSSLWTIDPDSPYASLSEDTE